MKIVANVFSLTTVLTHSLSLSVRVCVCLCICLCLVKDLSEIVPELLDKLRVVEEKKPVNNVTTNILKIRELIAQARSVAKKVHHLLNIRLILTDPLVGHIYLVYVSHTFSHI